MPHVLVRGQIQGERHDHEAEIGLIDAAAPKGCQRLPANHQMLRISEEVLL